MQSRVKDLSRKMMSLVKEISVRKRDVIRRKAKTRQEPEIQTLYEESTYEVRNCF